MHTCNLYLEHMSLFFFFLSIRTKREKERERETDFFTRFFETSYTTDNHFLPFYSRKKEKEKIETHRLTLSKPVLNCTIIFCFDYCHTGFFSVFWPFYSKLVFWWNFSQKKSTKKSTQTYTISQELAAPNLCVSICLCPIIMCVSFFFFLCPFISLSL